MWELIATHPEWLWNAATYSCTCEFVMIHDYGGIECIINHIVSAKMKRKKQEQRETRRRVSNNIGGSDTQFQDNVNRVPASPV